MKLHAYRRADGSVRLPEPGAAVIPSVVCAADVAQAIAQNDAVGQLACFITRDAVSFHRI